MPTPPEMWQFLPICAQEPTVDQVSIMVPWSDIGAEIDERRHQHHAGRDIGGAAHDAARHRAEAGGAEILVVPVVELRRHLVPPRGVAGAARNFAHVVEPERQQHRLLEPLIDVPGRRRPPSRRRARRRGRADRARPRPPRAPRPWSPGRSSSRCSKAASMVLASHRRVASRHEITPRCRGLSERADAMSSIAVAGRLARRRRAKNRRGRR